MPRTTPSTEELKPLVVRLPLQWHEAFERQAKRRHRNLNGQMMDLIEQFLRETKEISGDDLVGARDD